jgi:tripartite-type tricarboxylate transporter receptor subunit TctC
MSISINNLKKFTIGAAIMAASITAASVQVSAGGYPSKPVRLIIPFGAGGGSDSLVRILQPSLEKNLGVDVVVINVPGAGSVTGSRRVLDAKPDGYQVLVNHTTLLTAVASGKADFSASDFEIAASGATMHLVSVVPKNSQINNLSELIAAAKDKSKTIIAGVNIGALNHFTMGMIENAVNGQKYRYVQTGGGAATTKALLGNHINVGILAGPEARRLHEAGSVKVIAALSDKRIPYLPNIPTAKENGIDVSIGIEYTWYMPKGSPKEALNKFAAAVKATMTDPKMVAKLKKRGIGASYYDGAIARKRVSALQAKLKIVAAGMK